MLERPDLEKIVELEANKLIKRLAEKKINLTLSSEVISMLVDKGYDPQYGARPMRRAIERLLEDPIAEAILRGDLTAGNSSRARKPEGTDKIEFADETPTQEKKQASPKRKAPAAKAKATAKPRAPRKKKDDK